MLVGWSQGQGCPGQAFKEAAWWGSRGAEFTAGKEEEGQLGQAGILVQVAKYLRQFVKTKPYLAFVQCIPITYKPRPVKMLEGSKCRST